MSGGILDQIDQSLNVAREQVCCCGCGAELREDGPSFYYATQDCQQRAMRAQAIRPEVVEDRPDYSMYSHPNGHAAWAFAMDRVLREMLTSQAYGSNRHGWPEENFYLSTVRDGSWFEPPGSYYRRFPGSYARRWFDETRHEASAQELPQRTQMPQYLAYARRCRACGAIGAPTVEVSHEPDSEITSFGGANFYLSGIPTVTHRCGACNEEFPYRVSGSVARRGHGWLLQVTCDNRFTEYVVTDLQLQQAPDPESYVRRLWQRMTDDVGSAHWQPTHWQAGNGTQATTTVPSFDERNRELLHNLAQANQELIERGRRRYRDELCANWTTRMERHHDDHGADGVCCIDALCPNFGSTDMGEGTCPVEHSCQGRPLNAGQVRAAVDAAEPDGPPRDPRARALWLRRHRNTGPQQQRRAPRSIEPRRRR